MAKKSNAKWQYGDFQTPIELARDVVRLVRTTHCAKPDFVIEPTCGVGAFLQASYELFENSDIYGLDINAKYVDEAQKLFANTPATGRVHIKQGDFFDTDWAELLKGLEGHLLIIGNPPWVTTSELSILDSKNHPRKSNFQNRRGIDAITGSGNFDISEWMLLEQLKWMIGRNGTIAMLCKTAVARKVINQIDDQPKLRVSTHIYPIDAKAHFDASVEACLFVLSTDSENTDCRVYESIYDTEPCQIIGKRNEIIVSDINKYEKWHHLRGQDIRYIWRTGVKHDCSKVMELSLVEDGYENGLNEIVELEDSYLYPLLKSSDIARGNLAPPRKVVLVTQKNVGEETSTIRELAPETWKYLVKYRALLSSRKSSIYRNRPEYSIFGVGSYSFKPWKIAVSGLYKHIRFALVGPIQEKPVFFDDTVYFLSFDHEDEARFILDLMTSTPATEFLESLIFWDEKRPITAKLLRQLSLKQVAIELGKFEQFKQWVRLEALEESGQLRLALFETRTDYTTHSD
jgi:tRNA1(Val) A37 N6-methylase TrmN6